jgi:hypothetical protein
MAILNDLLNPLSSFKAIEFERAVNSIDEKLVVGLIERWVKRYFKERHKDCLDVIRRLLARIVFQIGEVIK